MKRVQIIKADGAEYCSQFIRTIPNGIINKKSTGCGMSSVALENSEPTILVVPTQELIKNKVAQRMIGKLQMELELTKKENELVARLKRR